MTCLHSCFIFVKIRSLACYAFAGTTANVGVQIYGEEAYSSACHLCKQDAFQRSGEDMFLIATESSLGPLWKVCLNFTPACCMLKYYISVVK